MRNGENHVIRAVLFDLDGTLVNSLADLAFAVNTVLRRHGYPTHPQQAFRYFAGNGNAVMMRRALPEDQRDDARVERLKNEFFEVYRPHCADQSRPYPGVEEMLRSLKSAGIRLAVVTNKAQPMTDAVIPAMFGQMPVSFDAVIGQREGVPTKPDPAMARLAMRALGVVPRECLFVGDSAADMQTGCAAGACPVGVLWGFRDRQELLSAGAKYLIEQPSELPEIIQKIHRETEE